MFFKPTITVNIYVYRVNRLPLLIDFCALIKSALGLTDRIVLNYVKSVQNVFELNSEGLRALLAEITAKISVSAITIEIELSPFGPSLALCYIATNNWTLSITNYCYFSIITPNSVINFSFCLSNLCSFVLYLNQTYHKKNGSYFYCFCMGSSKCKWLPSWNSKPKNLTELFSSL